MLLNIPNTSIHHDTRLLAYLDVLLNILLIRDRPGPGLPLHPETRPLLGNVPCLGSVIEQRVKLLKSLSGSLGIEEIDDRHKGTVEAHPDQEELPPKAFNTQRRNLNNNKVPQPVGGSSERGGLRSELEFRDLSGVEPWGSDPSETGVGGDVDNDEDDSGDTSGVVTVDSRELNEHGDKHHANRLSGGTVDERLTTAPAVNKQDRDEGEHKERQPGATTNDQRQLTLNVEYVLEEVGGVEDDRVDTGKLLHHLDTVGKAQATEGLFLAAGKVVLEQDLAAGCRAGLGGEGIGDGLELALDVGGVDGLVVEVGKDLEGLLAAILGHEETGGLGEADEHDHGDDTEDGLQDDGRAELDVRVAVLGGGVGNPVGDDDT